PMKHQLDERTDMQHMRCQRYTADELVLVPPGSVEVTSRHGALAATLAGMEPGTPISAQYAQAPFSLGAGQVAEQPAADGHCRAEGQPMPSTCRGAEARQRQRQYRQQLVGRPDTTSPGQREQQPAPGTEDPRQRFGNRQGYQQGDGQYGRQGRQQTEQRRP